MSSQLDNPQAWVTGGDAPTEKQTAFISTLAKDKGVNVDPSSLNKSEASQKIGELKGMSSTTGTGGGGDSSDASGGTASAAEGPISDPNTWATGDDQATGKQKGYIAVMAKEAGETPPSGSLGKSEASKKIEELKDKTGM